MKGRQTSKSAARQRPDKPCVGTLIADWCGARSRDRPRLAGAARIRDLCEILAGGRRAVRLTPRYLRLNNRALRMTKAIEHIVDAYVRLGNRPALEDLRTHRQKLAVDLKGRSGPYYFSLPLGQIDCPSADNLRPVRRFARRGSSSSFRRPAADAASVGLR